MSGSQAGYWLDEETLRAPDVAFVATERLENRIPFSGFFNGSPDLAVEVLSPSDRWHDISEKVAEYLAAGCRLVWVVHPFERRVYVYRPNLPVRVLERDDELSGEDVLPGFAIRVADIFASL
jgi:Uma2 family endonuclease